MSDKPKTTEEKKATPVPSVEGVLKKITPKNVFGNIKAHMKEVNKTFLVMRVIGSVGKIRSVPSPFGDATALIGTFEAIRGTDGEVFTSTRCFLPAFITDDIEANFADGSHAQFAIDLYAKPDDEKSLGYEFVAKNLVAPANPLEALKSSIKNEPLMLEKAA